MENRKYYIKKLFSLNCSVMEDNYDTYNCIKPQILTLINFCGIRYTETIFY
jgi:hypothetical protein